MGTPRLMIVLLGAAALMVGAIAALALDNWWILVAVMGLHLVASTLVIGYAWMRASQTGDKPDPVTEARIEEERAHEKHEPRAKRAAKDREVFG